MHNNERIFKAGFYDNDGVWFTTWERHWGNRNLSSLANTYNYHPTYIRYYTDTGYGEMTIKEYKKSGLPD